MSNDHTELSKRIGRSGEDYLEAIGHLCHKNGSAQVSDIAQMLNVKKPSVTAAMRKLALSWGVVPARSVEYTSTDVMFYVTTQLAREKLGLVPGDKIVITGGVTNGKSGNTNLIKVEVI